MQVVLVMFRAEGERRSFSVTKDVTVIGRREDCDLRIPVSEVSRKHCRVIVDGDTVRAEDLGSSNGTFHNGQRIAGSVVIEPGDSVQVGPVVFVLQVDGVPTDEELAPFQDRAAHNLDDSVGAPPDLVDADMNTAGEDLELLEGPTRNNASGSQVAIPMADADGSGPLVLDDDAGDGGRHEVLNEDELLMDLNTPEESREKH